MKKILALDGGGIRGILQAAILQELEHKTGKRIYELFDLIAGTSTGGILACSLMCGHTAEAVGKLYSEHGSEIFSRGFWHRISTLWGVTYAKYDNATLSELLRLYCGAKLLAQAPTNLLVTAYNLDTRRPFFFKSWKAEGKMLKPGETASDRNFYLRDVALATSAAPTYFPPAQIKNINGAEFKLVDGGVFANNPAASALSSTRVMYSEDAEFIIVSIGTGIPKEDGIDFSSAEKWGKLDWVRPVLDIFMDGQSDVVDYQLDQELREDHHRMQIMLPEWVSASMDNASSENIEALIALSYVFLEQQAYKIKELVPILAGPGENSLPPK